MIALLLLLVCQADVPERPAILERVPTELPMAEERAWAERVRPEALDSTLKGLADPVRRALAEADRAYRQGLYPDAIRSAYAALEAAPDLPPALSLLGTTYFRLQRYGDTTTCFERLLRTAPDELWRTQALGHAYYSLGDFERARGHYERVVATGRAGVDAVRGLGLSELKLGNEARGIEVLEGLLTLSPDHAAALEALANVRFERGETERALVLARRASELSPFEPKPWFLLTSIYLELEREAEALEAETRWRTVDRLVQDLRRLEADAELAPRELGIVRAIVAKRFELGDLDGASLAAMRGLGRVGAASDEALSLACDTADALQDAGAVGGSDRWAERIQSAFEDEEDAWRWAAGYWAERRDRVRQIEAQRRLQELRSRPEKAR